MAKKDNQKLFLDAYEKAFGNISQACKMAGIDRTTFYAWKNDAKFQEQLAQVQPQERFVDFAEDALVKKISKGDTTAIIFALKTKGKHRGYVERNELTGKDGGPLETTHRVIEPTE